MSVNIWERFHSEMLAAAISKGLLCFLCDIWGDWRLWYDFIMSSAFMTAVIYRLGAAVRCVETSQLRGIRVLCCCFLYVKEDVSPRLWLSVACSLSRKYRLSHQSDLRKSIKLFLAVSLQTRKQQTVVFILPLWFGVLSLFSPSAWNRLICSLLSLTDVMIHRIASRYQE